MDKTAKAQAANTTISLGSQIALGTAQAMAFGYAASQTTGPARYVFKFFTVTNALGTLALTVAQGVTLFIAKGGLDELDKPTLRSVR